MVDMDGDTNFRIYSIYFIFFTKKSTWTWICERSVIIKSPWQVKACLEFLPQIGEEKFERNEFMTLWSSTFTNFQSEIISIVLGPGKLLPFGVRKNPKIRPQIHMVGGLKSAHSDKGHHVSSKKRKYLFGFFFLAPSHSSRFLHKREAGIAEI